MPTQNVRFSDTRKFRDFHSLLALDKGKKRNLGAKLQKYIIHVISASIPLFFNSIETPLLNL